MSFARVALADVSNISQPTPDKDNMTKAAKVVIPKLSKRRQSVSSAPRGQNLMESTSQPAASLLWSELERIVNLHIPDQAQSARALSIIDTLRGMESSTKSPTPVSEQEAVSNQDIPVCVAEEQEAVKQEAVRQEELKQEQQFLEQEAIKLEAIKQEAIKQEAIKLEAILAAQEQAAKEQEAREEEERKQKAIEKAEEARMQEEVKEQKKALRREKARKKREQDQLKREKEKEEREKAALLAVATVTADASSCWEDKVASSTDGKEHEGVVGGEDGEGEEESYPGFLSDEEDSGSCFIHWDAATITTTPPLSTASLLPCATTSSSASAKAKASAKMSSRTEDHKRLHTEVTTSSSSSNPTDSLHSQRMSSTQSRKSPRKSPRHLAKALPPPKPLIVSTEQEFQKETRPISPDLAKFNSLLLDSPRASSTDSSSMSTSNEAIVESVQAIEEQDEQEQDHHHEEDEFDFDAGMGIIHMDNSHSLTDSPAREEISSMEVTAASHREESSELMVLNSGEKEGEEEEANLSSRAKRRNRRASLSISLPSSAEGGVSRARRSKKTRTVPTGSRADDRSVVSTGQENETEAKAEGGQSVTKTTASSNLTTTDELLSHHTRDEIPLRVECIDTKVVELVLKHQTEGEGDKDIPVSKHVLVTDEHCQKVTQTMKKSFDSFVRELTASSSSSSSNSDPVLAAALSKATAAISRPVPPASYLTLLLAVAHMSSPNALLPQHLLRFHKLQLALLTISSPPPSSQVSATANPFATLSTLSSSTTSATTPKASKKRLRFQEAGVPVSACVSPPNDREPGSAQKFESYARMLEDLLLAFDVLTECRAGDEASTAAEGKDDSLSCVVTSLISSLAVLSTRTAVVNALLPKVLESPNAMSGTEIETETGSIVTDISQMAKILCTELTLRQHRRGDQLVDGSNSQSQSQSNASSIIPLAHLAMPAAPMMSAGSEDMASCQFRSVLRHRTSWVMTSIIRYYLRWLLDETPLRARMVLLAGDYPTISCRSTFRENYLLVAPPVETTLVCQVRAAAGSGGGRGRGGAKKGRRESVGVASAASALPCVLDMGFSSIFVQALDQVYQGLSMCFTHHHRHSSLDTAAKNRASQEKDILSSPVLLSMEDMLYYAGEMSSWVTAEWTGFLSGHVAFPGRGVEDDCHLEHLAWQLQFAQTVVAAEQARLFLHRLLTLDAVRQIGSVSGVWGKLDHFADVLRRNGLPEDSHYALLSNTADFLSLLAISFLPSNSSSAGEEGAEVVNITLLAGMAVDPLNTLSMVKALAQTLSQDQVDSIATSTPRKSRLVATEKALIKESQDSCTFIFDFPCVEKDPNSTLSGGHHVSRRCFDHYNSDYMEQEEEEEC